MKKDSELGFNSLNVKFLKSRIFVWEILKIVFFLPRSGTDAGFSSSVGATPPKSGWLDTLDRP